MSVSATLDPADGLTNTHNRGGNISYSVSSPSSTTRCTNRTWRARKSLRTNQTFWTRISSVSLEKQPPVSQQYTICNTTHGSHFCSPCLLPFVQELHLCLVGHQILQGPEDHTKTFRQLLDNVTDSFGWYSFLNYFRSYTYIRTRITARSICTRNTNRTWGSFLARLSCRALFSWWTLKTRTGGSQCSIKGPFHKTCTNQNTYHLHSVQALRSNLLTHGTVTGFRLDTHCRSWKAWHPALSSLSRKTHNASLSCSSSWARRTIRTLKATTTRTECLGLY